MRFLITLNDFEAHSAVRNVFESNILHYVASVHHKMIISEYCICIIIIILNGKEGLLKPQAVMSAIKMLISCKWYDVVTFLQIDEWEIIFRVSISAITNDLEWPCKVMLSYISLAVNNITIISSYPLLNCAVLYINRGTLVHTSRGLSAIAGISCYLRP